MLACAAYRVKLHHSLRTTVNKEIETTVIAAKVAVPVDVLFLIFTTHSVRCQIGRASMCERKMPALARSSYVQRSEWDWLAVVVYAVTTVASKRVTKIIVFVLLRPNISEVFGWRLRTPSDTHTHTHTRSWVRSLLPFVPFQFSWFTFFQ